ncbi:MAG: CDP-alcohol phosphatidyltransferase family protein [Spirochaetaceae bacterium]|jgi:hypothetical protein|nr:CDP-alcohol phosphatidyltransferase family protein [Spirochaetaceae bacterium]
MKTRYTFAQVRASLPAEKRRQDGTVTRFFYRPLSMPAAWLFLRMGFSPNAVTYLGILCSIAGFVLALIPSMAFQYGAVAAFALFAVCDCADGNMARTIRFAAAESSPADNSAASAPNPHGEWLDALGGYCTYTAILLGMGCSAMFVAGGVVPGIGWAIPGGSAVWMLIAAAACAGNLLMRLAFQSFRAMSGSSDKSYVGGEKRFSEEIGITGWMPPVYLAGVITGFLPWALVFYAVVYCGGCFLTIIKLLVKVERAAAEQRSATKLQGPDE